MPLLKAIFKLAFSLFLMALLFLGLGLAAWGIYAGAVEADYARGCFLLLAGSTSGAAGKYLLHFVD